MSGFANARRLHVGLDVSVDPQELGSWQEDMDKDILARTEKYVVKLYGRDDADQPAGEFTGTMYATQPLIWTAGHALHFGKSANSSGATSFVAHYQDGFEERVAVEVQPEPHLDLMLLKGTKVSAQPLTATTVERRDAVYALGCRPGSSQVSIARGTVSAIDLDAWYITARADAGWSGGAVVNRHGKLIGLVQGVGRDTKSVRVLPSTLLHWFAVMHGQPGLAA